MAKRLLIETRMNSLSLCEGKTAQTHPGCLGTLSGPCADYNNPTRNNNFYSRKLWENVFKDPLVVESLEDRVLIGELDHPGDRLETKAKNACIVMTGYEFDDVNKTVNGTFDILDTPNGQILKSLLDYGCKIGVSSRGEGEVTSSNGVDTVDEDSYYFVGFDAVVLPAVKKAKPTLQESLKRESLRESLETQIKASTTKSELDLIKKVIEATELPNADSLLESVNIKFNELEGVNDSSNLMEDLEKSATQIQVLTENNRKLNKEVTISKSKLDKLSTSRLKLVQKEHSLLAENKTLKSDLSESSERVKQLEEELRLSKRKVGELKKSLRITNSRISILSNQNESLQESLNKSQTVSAKKSKQISKLQDQLTQTDRDYQTRLSESKAREQKAIASAKRASTSLKESTKRQGILLESYVKNRSKTLGINPDRILESIKPGMTTSQIDKLLDEEVDRTDRYSKLPTTSDSLLRALSESQVSISSMKPDTETAQSKFFMEQVLLKK